MATNTPQTVVEDYLETFSTEKDERTQRRRSEVADPEDSNPAARAPLETAAGKRQAGKMLPQASVIRSSPRIRQSVRASIGGQDTEEVTPRHIIQNMLAVQGTAQPITRRKQRRSDVAMRPPASTSTRRAAPRRSSISSLDLEDVTRRFTPRTNIAGFLEQAPEETPALRKDPTTTESHSTTQNVSSFMLNEVGVSLLEGSSSNAAAASVSSSGGRIRGKKRSLNIRLPPASAVTQTQSPETTDETADISPGSGRYRKGQEVTTTTADSTSSPGPQAAEGEDAQSATSSSRGAATDRLDTLPLSEGEQNQSSDRNIFHDVFGDVDGQEEDGPEAEATPREASDVQSEAEVTPRRVSDGQGEAEQTQSSKKRLALAAVDRSMEEAQLGAGEASPQSASGMKDSSVGGGGISASESFEVPHALRRSTRNSENVVDASPVSGTAEKRARVASAQDSSSTSRTPKQTPQRLDTPSSSTNRSKRQSSSTPASSKQQGSTRKRQTLLTLASSGTAAVVEEAPEESAFVNASRRNTPLTSTPRLASRPSRVTPTPGTSAGRRSSSVVSGGRGYSPSVSGQLQNTPGGGGDGGSALKQQRLSLRGAGEGSSRRSSRSSVVSRLSNRFENLEPTNTEEPPVLQAERDDQGFNSNAQHLQMPDLISGPSDQDESSDEEKGDGYSPLKTPKLPRKQPTPATVVPPSAGRNKRTGSSQAAVTQVVKRRPPATSRSRRTPRQGLPTSVVKATFSHFCRLRVSKEAIEEVQKMSEQYWKNMAEDLEAYAMHAHRHTINHLDVELLMRRQGFITDTCSLNTLIAKYLPLELRQELIPIARSGNELEPNF